MSVCLFGSRLAGLIVQEQFLAMLRSGAGWISQRVRVPGKACRDWCRGIRTVARTGVITSARRSAHNRGTR